LPARKNACGAGASALDQMEKPPKIERGSKGKKAPYREHLATLLYCGGLLLWIKRIEPALSPRVRYRLSHLSLCLNRGPEQPSRYPYEHLVWSHISIRLRAVAKTYLDLVLEERRNSYS